MAHIRGHETDRLAALTAELNGLGGSVSETEDGLRITPAPLHGGRVRTYHDHRMATAGAVLGLRVPGVVVEDVETTAKTLPGLRRPLAHDARRARRRGAAAMSWRDLDEGDIRVRPSRKGSRPRTKERPAHADAIVAMVIGVDRGRYTCLVPKGALGKKEPERVVTAMKAREIGRTRVVVGDDVALVGDLAGGPDALARIVRIEERRSVLRRTADDTDPFERIIVANADQLVIVTALADPEPRPRMVDRCLVAAYDADLVPLLALTKADLVDPAPFLSQYTPLEVEHVVTSRGDGEVSGRRGPARAPRGARVGARRALRRGQEHPRQRAGAGGLARDRGRQRHHRARAGTRRPTPSRCGCPTTPTGGSSTPPASGPSASPTSTSTTSSTTSPTSPPAPTTAPRVHARRAGVRPRRLGGGWARGPLGKSRLESLRRLLSSRSSTDDHY